MRSLPGTFAVPDRSAHNAAVEPPTPKPSGVNSPSPYVSTGSDLLTSRNLAWRHFVDFRGRDQRVHRTSVLFLSLCEGAKEGQDNGVVCRDAKEYAFFVDALQKLEILAGAARYDVSCASSGSRRRERLGGVGNASASGICHSWSEDGRCISLLKVLFSNACLYDCAYCANRCSNPIPRATFTVDELSRLTLHFYRRNYIEGLFLSSGIIVSPDYTMERLTLVAEKLRHEHHFGGYIHLKAIPGASPELIRRAGVAADRLSVNIELPSEVSLRLLAPQKKKDDIVKPMAYIGQSILENREERRTSRKAPLFAPAGQSTQLIVGASPEPDAHILRLSDALYSRFRLKRVYYSAYIPVNDDTRLPRDRRPDLKREHRLYQADWLLRLYGFTVDDILPTDQASLDRDFDPKTAWALRNLHRFPVDVNRADYDTLLRVPGIGLRSAHRIVSSRRWSSLDVEALSKLGVVMKRARFFLEAGGKSLWRARVTPEIIRRELLAPPRMRASAQATQPELFCDAELSFV